MSHDSRVRERGREAASSAAAAPKVGARTQVQALGGWVAVQASKVAAEGVAGRPAPLPHLDTIQRAFGRHDARNIEAHTGGAAGTAARALGAEAYAAGNHVAFDRPPSLHTAAHEAAHVIQQRGGVQLKGGVGQPGDPYERHADAVADAVVAGRSAEGLLDGTPGRAPQHAPGGGARDAVVQRTGPDDTIAPPAAGPTGAGFIDSDDGSNVHVGAGAATPTVDSGFLPAGTRVLVGGAHPTDAGWWYVTAAAGGNIVRGYLQGLRVAQFPDDPWAELHTIQGGEQAQSLANQKFGAAVQDGLDLRFYENVLLYANERRPGAPPRNAVTGDYQTGATNNIGLVAGKRLWLVTPQYALGLAGNPSIPHGSITGGLGAKLGRVMGHLEDVLASVAESPRHFGEVAAEEARVILDHIVEIVGVTTTFILAEQASFVFAASGAGMPVALVIQLLLTLLGAAAFVRSVAEATRHGIDWLTHAWSSNGDPRLIAEASKDFLRMLIAIALAVLAAKAANGAAANSVELAGKIATSGLTPATAVVSVGSGGAALTGGTGAAAGEGAQLGPVNPGGGAALFTNNDNDDPSTGGSQGIAGKVAKAEGGLDPADGLCDSRASTIAQRLKADGVEDVLRIQITPEEQGGFVEIVHPSHTEVAPYHVVPGLEVGGQPFVIDPTTHAGLMPLADYLSSFIRGGSIAGEEVIGPGRVIPGGITHY